MGVTKKRKKRTHAPGDSILGKGVGGVAKSFHKPKGDLTRRQRNSAKLNDYRDQ